MCMFTGNYIAKKPSSLASSTLREETERRQGEETGMGETRGIAKEERKRRAHSTRICPQNPSKNAG